VAFEKGRARPEGSGRKKGSVNQKTKDARELMERLGFDPLEFLFRTAMGDWKSLGYEKKTETRVLKDGGTIEVDVIEFKDRLLAAKEAAKYVYPQTKAVELSSNESQGFVIKIEDYGVKK
jgi:hypothetical protein